MNVKEMAEAHLSTVQRTIVDLEKQKVNIEEEIGKLSKYLQEGVEELQKENNSEK